jgi:hypothetical protein
MHADQTGLFRAVLSLGNKYIMIHLWCQLLPLVTGRTATPPSSTILGASYAHVYEHHDYNRHPFVPIGMEALVHDKPHNAAPTRTLHKSFCPGHHVHRTLSMLEILDPHNKGHTHLRGSLFQAQISHQPIGHTRRSSNYGSNMTHGHSPWHQVSTITHLYPPSTR